MDSGINIEGRIGITGGEETAVLRPVLVISFGLGIQILRNVTKIQNYLYLDWKLETNTKCRKLRVWWDSSYEANFLRAPTNHFAVNGSILQNLLMLSKQVYFLLFCSSTEY